MSGLRRGSPLYFGPAFWSRSSFLDLYHLFHLHDLSLPLALCRIVLFGAMVWCCGLDVTYEAWGIGG